MDDETGEEVRRCPVKLVSDLTARVLAVYNPCRTARDGAIQPNGILPAAGGYQDQSHTLMEAFAIIDGHVNEAWAEKRKRDER